MCEKQPLYLAWFKYAWAQELSTIVQAYYKQFVTAAYKLPHL